MCAYLQHCHVDASVGPHGFVKRVVYARDKSFLEVQDNVVCNL